MRTIVRDLSHRFTPYRGWIGELRNPSILRRDIQAGITVALVLVPQSMAYAQLAGLPTYYGLYASFLPVIVAALFGSSRQVHTGPVAIVSLLTASALAPFATANPEQYAAYAVLLAFLVGVFQLSLGLLRLGFFVDFLSHPVVVGFTNGAAIIIATSQLDKVFGVEKIKGDHHYETVWNILTAAVDKTHLPTFVMALATIAFILLLRKFAPKIPGVLVAVLFSTLAAWLVQFETRLGGQVVGYIPAGLPAFQMPEFDFKVIMNFSINAIAIALIGFTEAISVAKAIAATTRQRLDANQGLVGQGLSNITASLFQGYAVSGSFSRSAVNLVAGAQTGFAAVVSGIVVAITLLFFTPLLYHLPQATLAAVIILAVFNLIKFKPIKYAWRVQKHDAVVAVITFILTLLLAPHLEKAILIGVLISMGLYLYRTMRPRIAVLSLDSDGSLRDAETNILKVCPKISILRFDGPLFFANTTYFEEKVLERVASKPGLRFIIIDAEGINEIDATGEEMLHRLALRLYSLGIDFLFSRTKKQVMDVFIMTGFASPEWRDHFFRSEQAAIQYAWERIADCQEQSCPLTLEQIDCPARQLHPGDSAEKPLIPTKT